MCANNLPRVALDSGETGFEPATYWLQVQHPYRSATEPHSTGVHDVNKPHLFPFHLFYGVATLLQAQQC